MQLALFDFDHTVTYCDTYARFLRCVATPRQVASARWTIGPWLLGYRTGLLSACAIRARATKVTFTKRDAREIIDHGNRYARDVLPTLLRPEMMRRIGWHQSQGHDVVLVSGSLDLYLAPWCAQHGLALICNRLEHGNDGLFSGSYDGEDIGPHKAREIRARYDLPGYERIHAYGDSREDKPMLALAHERWFAGRKIA